MSCTLWLGAVLVGILHMASANWYELPKAQPIGVPRLCRQDKDYCFSYDRSAITGPFFWDRVCDTKKCFGGANQSPILIDPRYVYKNCDPYNELGYNYVSVTGMLENDGYYAKIASENGNLHKAVLSGVPGCDDTYQLDSLHFHFGKTGEARGSEHVIQGKNYDSEIHLVHLRQVNGGSDRVAGQAVVGVFLSTTEGEWNWQIDQILNRVAEIEEFKGDPCNDTECHNKEAMQSMKLICPHWTSGNGHCGGKSISFNPDWLLPTCRDFYYYYGSLTTPTLSESVLWHVMKQPIRITQAQLELLRRLESRFLDNKGFNILISENGNLRPLQNLNGRTVYGNVCY